MTIKQKRGRNKRIYMVVKPKKCLEINRQEVYHPHICGSQSKLKSLHINKSVLCYENSELATLR